METKNYTLDTKSKTFTSTRNACKVCTPLGASIVFKGIEGCLPMLHGSQGCATYIRRYLISHYKEPMDIASSNFSEESTVFGGNKQFNAGITNIISQYEPKVIAIASTCLSETIGEDVPAMIKEYIAVNKGKKLPEFIYASTPSYQGTHMEGFHEAVFATVKALAEKKDTKSERVNIFPGFVSTEDLRNLKEILEDFGLEYNMLPDYSESLDNPAWGEFVKIPEGGTTLDEIKSTGSAKASIEFGHIMNKGGLNGRVKNNHKIQTASSYLEKEFGVKKYGMGLPIGIKETDIFFDALSQISGKEIPQKYVKQRGRLIDSYIDAHKHVFGQKAFVYGEEDLVVGLTMFLTEIGVKPILIASGGESGALRSTLENLGIDTADMIVQEGMDFEDIHEKAKELQPDFFIGNSRGYYIARDISKPIVRVGFPIHDRYGSQRVKHLSYEGTQDLFDRVTNAIVQYKQDNSDVGYKYI